MRQIAQQIGADPDAEDSEEGASATVSLLRELQDHVESIDHASDLATVGGMAPLLRCLGSRQPAVAAAAAEVLATAVQNNPKAQGEALAAGAGFIPDLLADQGLRRVVECLARSLPPAGAGVLLAAASSSSWAASARRSAARATTSPGNAG